jgi:hypothetical protein
VHPQALRPQLKRDPLGSGMAPKAILVLAPILWCALAESQVPQLRSRCGEQPRETLFVFVGRRVAVQPVGTEMPPRQPFIRDSKYLARYDILRVVCGTHPPGRIEFDVYDHYGKPAFSHFETVLLYVGRFEGRWVHAKYLYDPAYETADGDWAGCGDPYALDEPHRGELKAEPIRFKSEVSFPVDGLTETQINERYPPAYFGRRGDRVVCKAGARIAALFTIKRDGFLRAREVFK